MKFSIITITHNRAHLIGETIESVLKQTYKDFEHIIIDDGSSDNTQEVINSNNDKRIKYYKYPKHNKRSFLRNEGIRKSGGDIICILDSDDSWHKDKLTTLFELFNNKPEVVFVIHNVLKSDKSFIYNHKADFYNTILKEVLANNILPYPFYSFRKSLLKTTEFYDESMVDGQHDFFLRITSQFNVYYSSKVLSFKRAHSENISNTSRVSALVNYNVTLKKLLNRSKITFKEFNNHKNHTNLKIAKFYIENDQKKLGFKYLNQILKETKFINKIYLKSLILKFSNA